MINIKHLTIKNFMSVGNVTQSIDFSQNALTLVLGENLDVGDGGSRNGAGKTTIINALSYALYGCALTNIKKDNLINKINGKNMLVSVTVDINEEEYRIERGRKPAVLKLYKNGIVDESQGDVRETQHTIEQIFGMSHEIFKHIVALNTYTEAFLSMRAADQRAIIEELLGITVLSEKSEILKEIIRQTKNQVKEEEYRIQAVKQANDHIDKQIKNLQIRQKAWKNKKNETINTLTNQLERLVELDIEQEMTNHKGLETYLGTKKQIDECKQWISQIDKQDIQLADMIETLDAEIKLLDQHVCHSCGQKIHDDKQTELKNTKQKKLDDSMMQIITNESQREMHLETLDELGALPPKPTTYYQTLNEAYDHKNKVESLSNQLSNLLEEEDPYKDQIKDLTNNGIQVIDYDTLNELKYQQGHQEFLLNLLTNKDSFIRKKIIDQNLGYLNTRLTHYLKEVGLPHDVKFLSDLGVEISEHGRDLDFDNLSRGERNRLILSLSWAFRDVWESFFNHINVLFVDELIDSGLDTAGVENAVHILKHMARHHNKSVWLITHREELLSRVSNTVKVVKEAGFTTYETI